MVYIYHNMGLNSTPSLLPIFRSQQQAELLAWLLDDPEREASLTQLATNLAIPLSSVSREVNRAESAGLLVSHKIGNTKLVRANTSSPYYAGLSEVLTRAFGPPHVLEGALANIPQIDSAYIYGSWAARYSGTEGVRPVVDIDLLILGTPDRDKVYSTISRAEQPLGRSVQISIRPTGWLENGTGNFHATIIERDLVQLNLQE